MSALSFRLCRRSTGAYFLVIEQEYERVVEARREKTDCSRFLLVDIEELVALVKYAMHLTGSGAKYL